MRGLIRTVVGFLMVYGAVGTMEVDPSVPLLQLTLLALAGLGLMLSGVSAIGKKT